MFTYYSCYIDREAPSLSHDSRGVKLMMNSSTLLRSKPLLLQSWSFNFCTYLTYLLHIYGLNMSIHSTNRFSISFGLKVCFMPSYILSEKPLAVLWGRSGGDMDADESL